MISKTFSIILWYPSVDVSSHKMVNVSVGPQKTYPIIKQLCLYLYVDVAVIRIIRNAPHSTDLVCYMYSSCTKQGCHSAHSFSFEKLKIMFQMYNKDMSFIVCGNTFIAPDTKTSFENRKALQTYIYVPNNKRW